jgi:hypothetical protein
LGLADLRDSDLIRRIQKSSFANVFLVCDRITSAFLVVKPLQSKFDRPNIQAFFGSQFDKLKESSYFNALPAFHFPTEFRRELPVKRSPFPHLGSWSSPSR